MTEQLNQAAQELSINSDNVAEFSEKHPLNCRWTLWYTKPQVDENETWNDLLKPVITFSSVEEFWGIFNSIPQPSELPHKSDYHLFREDIRPEWEDVKNAQGGKFNKSYNHKRDVDINKVWLNICLALIGEVLQDNEDEVNGVVYSNRKHVYKIALWTKSTDKKNLFTVGEKFKEVIDTDDLIEFYSHNDAYQKNIMKPLMMI